MAAASEKDFHENVIWRPIELEISASESGDPMPRLAKINVIEPK
jgi:hypothetical protein